MADPGSKGLVRYAPGGKPDARADAPLSDGGTGTHGGVPSDAHREKLPIRRQHLDRSAGRTPKPARIPAGEQAQYRNGRRARLLLGIRETEKRFTLVDYLPGAFRAAVSGFQRATILRRGLLLHSSPNYLESRFDLIRLARATHANRIVSWRRLPDSGKAVQGVAF